MVESGHVSGRVAVGLYSALRYFLAGSAITRLHEWGDNMIALIAGLLAATSGPPPERSTTICDVGLVALRDLPSINQNVGSDTYYDGDSLYQRDILAVCPKLVANLPVGYPLADSDARARARVGFPKPGEEQTRGCYGLGRRPDSSVTG